MFGMLLTPKPYVYKLTHKVSGRFYIGYRKANASKPLLRHWSEDLGIRYFTSCRDIGKSNFNEYTKEIIGEFENGVHAYFHEQALILESFSNPLLINKNARDKDGKPLINHRHSEATKRKIGTAHLGRVFSPEHREKISKSKTGAKSRFPRTEEYRKAVSQRCKGRVYGAKAIDNFKKGQRKRFERPEERIKASERAKIKGLTTGWESCCVVAVDPSGRSTMYKGVRQFAESVGVKERNAYHLFTKFNGTIVNKGRMRGWLLWIEKHDLRPWKREDSINLFWENHRRRSAAGRQRSGNA